MKLHFAIGVLIFNFHVALAAKAVPSKSTTPPKLAVARLAAGCFWGVEESFRQLPGVISTRVGYEGGTDANPVYAAVSSGQTGHAETVEINYDPTKITYEELLTRFFKMHDPTTPNRQGNDRGTQYRSTIFFSSEADRAKAKAFMDKVEKSGAWKSKIITTLEPAGIFHPAEEYHQKYLVKNPGGYDNHFVRELSFDAKKK